MVEKTNKKSSIELKLNDIPKGKVKLKIEEPEDNNLYEKILP